MKRFFYEWQSLLHHDKTLKHVITTTYVQLTGRVLYLHFATC
jgi:hypothetical protein